MTGNALKRLASVIDRGLGPVSALMAALGTIALMGIVASYCTEVVARYLLRSPTAWASDTVTYLLCASIFFLLPALTREASHVTITILPERAGPRVGWLLTLAALLAGAIICGYVAYISGIESLRQARSGTATMALMPVPKWWVSLPIALGFGVSALEFLRHLVKHVVSPQERERC